MEGFLEFISMVCLATIFLIIAGLFLLSIVLGFQFFDFILDKSMCQVVIDKTTVFEGRCHFVSVESVGENGNSKHVVIYKDIFNLKPLNHYISENVKVKQR